MLTLKTQDEEEGLSRSEIDALKLYYFERRNFKFIDPEKKKKGGIRKIADLPEPEICRHPEHKPPMYIVLKPGMYEYTCPGCGKTVNFTVPHPPTL